MAEPNRPNSHKSTSASSSISDDSFSSALFPDCDRLSFVKKLSEAKFPVYLVRDNKTDQLQAIKIFPWEDDNQPSLFYAREVRFSQFNHPNIISIIDCKTEQETFCSEGTKVSYVLMEYAKYGDFFDALITLKIPFKDIHIRTYFHQVLEGLEVLHNKGAAHLDLKLENLLIDENYTLKLTDFDLSYMPEDKVVKTRGTIHFRAPEVLNNCCLDPQAADIYSLGMMLFIFKTGGMIPYKEEGYYRGVDMKELKEFNPKAFWKKQCEFLGKDASFFSEDFKTLFMWMTQSHPEKRPTIMQIKRSKWYLDEVCSKEELFVFMNGRFEFL